MNQPDIHTGINVADAMKLRRLWRNVPAPSCIITSPPYLDMHDYGNESRIGVRGQSIDDYIRQMTDLFRQCHRIATANATFWLVAGSVRRDGRLVTLPDHLARAADEVGWTLREAITWDKQKALPWTHHGELRDVTEQVLLFSKSEDYRFDATDIRSPIPNSIWWRRYPERYSPEGRMPTNLWSIAIPTQGSWSGTRSHYCPFPEELTYQMLSLTTVVGDVVLDPLAGIGSVPAMAEAMGRVGYGIELTPEYAEHYERVAQSARSFLERVDGDQRRRDDFRRTIIDLRLLKFAKVLGREMTAIGIDLEWIKVEKSVRPQSLAHHIVSGDFELVLADESTAEGALATACSAIRRPPLSKFGIDAKVNLATLKNADAVGNWFPLGQFWQVPQTTRPTKGRPHVLAHFVPNPDQVDDTPYA